MSIDRDGFDLDAARRAPSTTPAGERDRCPKCRSLSIEPRSAKGGAGSARPVEWDYWCGQCDNRFDEPIQGECE